MVSLGLRSVLLRKNFVKILKRKIIWELVKKLYC